MSAAFTSEPVELSGRTDGVPARLWQSGVKRLGSQRQLGKTERAMNAAFTAEVSQSTPRLRRARQGEPKEKVL